MLKDKNNKEIGLIYLKINSSAGLTIEDNFNPETNK